MFAVGADVLRTTLTDKTRSILVQIGDVVAKVIDADNVEWWQTVGLISRPPKAQPEKAACQVVVLRRGDRDIVIASRDLRGQALTGSLADGETCVYAAGDSGQGQARILLKRNGSINLYTRTKNQPDGKGMAIMVNPDNDSISVVNSKGFGLFIDENGVRLTAKDSALTLGSNGDCSLVGKQKSQVDGASIVLGSLLAPGVNSALTGVTGIAGKASLKTLIE